MRLGLIWEGALKNLIIIVVVVVVIIIIVVDIIIIIISIHHASDVGFTSSMTYDIE